MEIDLSDGLPIGGTYEETYAKWLDIFARIAKEDAATKITVIGPPWCWVPLLIYLQCKIVSPVRRFEYCNNVARALPQDLRDSFFVTRTLVEVLSAFRPETVDALWKCDMQWKTKRAAFHLNKEFVVTTYNSFYRHEVMSYIDRLNKFQPSTTKVVLVPCSADKPYPSALHEAVLQRMPADYYLMNVTGTLGLVPHALWPYAPHYDAGIPNFWRVFQACRAYFGTFVHDRIVVYSDFYYGVISMALESVEVGARFVAPAAKNGEYANLLDPGLLDDLQQAMEEKVGT